MKIERNYRTPAWTAAWAALLIGMATHMFGLVNVLHNYDDIAQQPRGYGAGVTSGRWLLSIMGDFAENMGGNYNLPFVNGLLFLVLISCSAGLLVSVLQIRHRKMAALIGGLFAVFPSAFSTLAFRYTAGYYGAGILLSVMAAWILPKQKTGLLLSALCTAFSLGIYQAYVPITIGIFVLQLIQQALEGKSTFWELVRRGFYDCLALGLGLMLYFILLNITLKIYATDLSDYQGVNQMGKLALQDIPGLVWETFYYFCTFSIKDYCGLAATDLIRNIYLLIGGVAAILIGYIWWKQVRKISIAIMTVLLCLLFPIAVNFIMIMCPDSWIYTLMVYSFVLVACVPIALCQCITVAEDKKMGKSIIEKCVSFLIAVLVCAYAYQTNVNYTALYYSNRQIENYLNSMVVQVRMTDGFDTKMEWALVGEIEDPLLRSYWQYEMDYGGVEFTEWMLKRYSWSEWIRNYYGYSIEFAGDEKIVELNANEEVRNMPCWPNEGSVQIIDNTVVIKCQENLLQEIQ